MTKRWSWLLLGLAALLLAGVGQAEEDKVFSGPQPGEKLPSFKVRGVYDDLEGKDLDFIAQARGKPTVLIFVHKLTRPNMALVRAITKYAFTRKKDDLHTFIVWLSPDRTEAAQYLKRARRSLNFVVPVGISLDGAEGPGAYGLNRKVQLTILVARDNKATANFALVQPGVTDAPAIAEAITRVVGGKPPTLKELNALAFPRRTAQPAGRDRRLLRLLRPVVQKTATPEEVQKAVQAVEKYVGDNKRLQRQLGQLARRGVAEKLGTEEAQKHLAAWVKKYGPARKDNK
jgi:hypothetical protein